MVAVGHRVAPEEGAPRRELKVPRTAKGPVLHRAVVLAPGRRTGRRERAEEVRHMAAEGQESRTGWEGVAVGDNIRPVVGAVEADIGREEAVDSSPGSLLVVLPAVSAKLPSVNRLTQRNQVLLTTIGWVVRIRHDDELFRCPYEYLGRRTEALYEAPSKILSEVGGYGSRG